jgi:hypothetical protein
MEPLFRPFFSRVSARLRTRLILFAVMFLA